MVIRWLRQMRREWELSIFVTMLVLATAGMITAVLVLLPSTTDDSGWTAPTARLRHIQTEYVSDFTPLGSYHAMRVRVPSHFRPIASNPVRTTVHPPKPPKPPVLPISAVEPAPVKSVRQLIYNGFIVTPSNEVLAFFQQTTVQGETIDSYNHFVVSNGTIENFRVSDVNGGDVTLTSNDGDRFILPRATPLQLH